MSYVSNHRRPCGCGGGWGPDRRPYPCPCGTRPRPEDCQRLYEECLWCGHMSPEECQQRRLECEARGADWPFYRGPCPGDRTCGGFCTCTPVTAVHTLLVLSENLNINAGDYFPFPCECFWENPCIRPIRGGVRVAVAGQYLLTLNLNLPSSPSTRIYFTVDGEEVEPSLVLPPNCNPRGATLTSIVTANAGSLIRVVSTEDVNLSGESLLVTLSVLRIA